VPVTALKTVSSAPPPSPMQCEPTRLIAVDPSVIGSTPICQAGPHSGSTGNCARSSIQSLNSARGQGFSSMSMLDGGPSEETQR
jgi:hypothetical protein